jgi:hypothetical protein
VTPFWSCAKAIVKLPAARIGALAMAIGCGGIARGRAERPHLSLEMRRMIEWSVQ